MMATVLAFEVMSPTAAVYAQQRDRDRERKLAQKEMNDG
jgi:hypothetical protein